MPSVGSPAGATLRRRRRSTVELPGTPGQKIYDYILLGLMIPGSLGAIFFFGGTVGWAGGPFMALIGLAAALYFLRPTFMADYRLCRAPLAGFLWLSVLVFVLFRYLVEPLIPYQTWVELLHIASYIAAYWVWSELARTRGRWRWLLILAIVLVTISAWYALIIHAKGLRLVLWQERPVDYEMRASGMFICPNHFGHVLAMTISFCVALVVNPSAGAPLRFVSGYGILVMLPALFLTFSRSAAFGLVAGVSCVILLITLRSGKLRFFWTALALPVIFVALFFALQKGSPDFKQRVDKALTGDVRTQIWPVSLLCFGLVFAAAQWGVVAKLDREINQLIYAPDLDDEFTAKLTKLCGRSLKIEPRYTPPHRFVADDRRAASFWSVGSPAHKAKLVDQAVEGYQRALTGNARDSEALFGLAKCMEIKKDVAGAEEIYLEIIRQDPTRIYHQIQYAIFLKGQGRYREAMDIFKKAQKHDPMSRAIMVNMRLLSRKLLDNPDR